MAGELNLLTMREPIDWLTDRLLHHSVLVAVSAPVVTALATIGIDKLYNPGEPLSNRRFALIVALVVLMAIATAGTAVVVERTKRLRSARDCVQVIKKLLSTLAESCGHPDHHVRANIMLLVQRPGTTSKFGAFRQVEISTAFNMDGDGDTDRHLTVDRHAGISGRAAQLRKAIIGDLTILETMQGPIGPAGPGWGLSPAEQALVRRSLKTVLSAPIFRPIESSEPPLLGTLQVDSDTAVQILKWDERTSARAQSFADVIALHLNYLLKD
jgi:hypothetical protein